jgi:hypothetical protein
MRHKFRLNRNSYHLTFKNWLRRGTLMPHASDGPLDRSCLYKYVNDIRDHNSPISRTRSLSCGIRHPVTHNSLLILPFSSKRRRGFARILADETRSRRRPSQWGPRHLRICTLQRATLRLLRHTTRGFVLWEFPG